jgi:hypothetical protein
LLALVAWFGVDNDNVTDTSGNTPCGGLAGLQDACTAYDPHLFAYLRSFLHAVILSTAKVCTVQQAAADGLKLPSWQATLVVRLAHSTS